MWWYSFIPSVVTTLIGILYLLYQFFAFKRSPLFDNAGKSFLTEVIESVVSFFSRHTELLIPTLLVAAVILIVYALLPTLCQGALINITARKRKGEDIKPIEGISFGLLSFLPLLEYHLVVKSFSLFSILTEAGFIVRNLGTNALKTLLPIFIAAGMVGFILTLLFTYSEFFIVLDKKPVLKSMGRSAKLVIMSWQHTFLIGILMLIIGLRIIINILAVLLVPALLVFSVGFLATVTLTKIGIVIGLFISFAGLLTASYFTGILNIFANAVWTFTYLELRHSKNIDELLGE